ncbi:type VI secretion system baseplate subunit TssF [Candidatus Poribacteria bacterium]
MNNLFGRKKNAKEYYDAELRYLDEAAREFAEAYPQRASFLNLNQLDDRDPYVERLFEGVAFLNGRIRQKLDDELPELTQSLLGFLWPHFLRPIPSLSVLEFNAIPGRSQEHINIQRGAEVVSRPVRDLHICQFRTCYDVLIRPITLVEAVPEGSSVIRFKFQIEGGADYSSLFSEDDSTVLDDYQKHLCRSIRLFIHDVDQPTASTLHLYLTNYVQKVIIKNTYGNSEATLWGQEGIQPVGFSPEEGLLPYTDHSFPGYRILQEYFSYPRKFSFFDLLGFERLQPTNRVESFDVQVFFDRQFPVDRRFTSDNFRLHCTPIVNLLKTDANPINVNHESTEYRINAPESCEVYSVDGVAGVVPSTMERRVYVPFYSFKHSRRSSSVSETSSGYYHTSTRLAIGPNSEGQPETSQETYIVVALPHAGADAFREETLSLAITCTNGRWARELKEYSICNPISESRIPEFIRFRNLTQPTQILYPPLQEGTEWGFISHLALNYLSINNAEAMQGILELYDWALERSSKEINRQHILGIHNISAAPHDVIYQDSVIRGTNITVEVAKANFADEGDIYLFGLVMREFLKSYASVNSFIQLTVVSHDSREEMFKWAPTIMR